MKTLIVLPAYNEESVLAETLKALRVCTGADLLVVDDGSTDRTSEIAAGTVGAEVARHLINLGLGAALETGFEAGRRGGYDALVTFDSDGQHNPKDVGRLLERLKDADVVIGVRNVHLERMPALKKLGNALLNTLTGVIFGIWCRDTQSGLRAFNRRAIEAISLRANRYEVSSEILYEAKRNGLRIVEVPVEVIYTDHSKGRGTGMVDGFRILWRMVLHQRGG